MSGSAARRLTGILLVITGTGSLIFAGLSIYIATALVYAPPAPIDQTPTMLGLAYRDVTFPSRGDRIGLRGWFIPGILPSGRLSAARTIIMVHGNRVNRIDSGAGNLELAGAFARHGFAVLAFDLRGMGASPPAPDSLGYFEQRDVLGAVDFLRRGRPPYPDLGRPSFIGGWGESMGAATLLLAAAREPAIQAVVSDSAYADILPVLEREVPRGDHLPPAFTPGALWAARALYGIDYYGIRPVDVIGRIAPRPLFLIHGMADTYVPTINFKLLVAAASRAPGSELTTWFVPGATHARSFRVMGDAYVTRVLGFFEAAQQQAGGGPA